MVWVITGMKVAFALHAAWGAHVATPGAPGCAVTHYMVRCAQQQQGSRCFVLLLLLGARGWLLAVVVLQFSLRWGVALSVLYQGLFAGLAWHVVFQPKGPLFVGACLGMHASKPCGMQMGDHWPQLWPTLRIPAAVHFRCATRWPRIPFCSLCCIWAALLGN